MAIAAKEFFVRPGTTASEICQQLGKEHAVRAKTAEVHSAAVQRR